MDRLAAWRQWWLNATISALAVIAIVALTVTGLQQLGWWALAAWAVGVAAVVVGAVVNRPRPFTRPLGAVAGDSDRRAALKAARRGIPVEPAHRQHEAIESVRREWYTASTQFGVWGLLAVNWTLQRSDSPQDAVELGFAFFGYVLLPIAVAGTAYYGLVLRRLDYIDAHDDCSRTGLRS